MDNLPNNYFSAPPEPKKGIPTWLGLLIIIIIAGAVGAGILGYQYSISNPAVSGTETPVADFSKLDKDVLLHKLFPNLEFENGVAKLSLGIQDDMTLNLSLKDSKEDYFISPTEKSLLLVAGLEGTPHVLGLFHSYLGLFDKNGNLLTPASSLPGLNSGTTIGDSGQGDYYDFDKDKPQFGADSGFFGFNDCNGVKYITFVASNIPNSSCGFDSATVYRIKDGNFEIVQTIKQDKYDEHYAWHMKLSGDQLVITKSNDYLNADISGCKETDYKVMNWDKTSCAFKDNETSGWKKYINNVYNYQINYIPTATVEETAGNGVKIKYQNGSIEICSTDIGACGNTPGIAGDEAQPINREVNIEGKKYNISGYIYNRNESLYLGLPNGMFVYLNMPEQDINTENELLKMLSTFKFTRQ